MHNGLRELRKSRGWTQDQLAQKSGVNRTIIARFETGQKGLNQKNLIKLADVFGVPVDEILRGGQADGAAS